MLPYFLFLLSFHHLTKVSAHCTTSTATKTFEKCTTLPSQDASVAWTFHPHNATLDLVFFGSFISPSGWVAWGINPNSPGMTGTRALIAFPDPNSGQVVLLPYILDPSVKLQKTPLLSRPLDIHLLSSSATLYGGRLATIHRGAAIQIHATLKLVANKTKIHHVWNRGLYVQGYSPTIHPTTNSDLSSVTTIDVMSGNAATTHSNIHTLKMVHGVLNAISWGVLLPVGVVVARYLRHFESLGPAWFYFHAGIQLSAILLGTTGFAIGIRLGQMSSGTVYGLHRKLGISAFCLGSLQTLALLFRPKTTNKYRKYWKSYHHFVGYACVVLGVVNVFQGFEVMGEGRSYEKLSYCLSLSTLIGICIALEVNAWVIFCRKAEEDKLRREGLIVGSEKDVIKYLVHEEEKDDEEMETAVSIYVQSNQQMHNPIRGSVLNHRTINRNRSLGHQRIFQDYFTDNPTYPDYFFRRRFRMQRNLFLRIQAAIESHDPYFVQRYNAAGVLGLSSLQKINAAMRIIAYGVSADVVDDYIRIGKSTAIESVRKFVIAIVQIFGEQYLRSPNNAYIQRLMNVAEQGGFPGILVSIDCIHWKWKNCPTAWHGAFSGRYHEPTIILEAIASRDLWLWHAYFGLPGSLNDINVLDRSNLFSEWADGRAPKVNYTFNDHTYDMGYYLADGIYPPYPTFVKTISAPQGNKRKHFAQIQESARKDVERAFGVLQARFAIVRGPARFWDIETLKYIMLACIIMHNMIIKDERDMQDIDYDYETYDETPSIQISREHTNTMKEFMEFHHRIRDKSAHIQLQNDLVEHLWQKHGG